MIDDPFGPERLEHDREEWQNATKDNEWEDDE